MLPNRLLPALVVGFLVTSCAQLPQREAEPPPADSGDATADLIYHSLAADIAARRGRLDDAFAHYVWLARETRDPTAAEKAARIGLHLSKNGETLRAAALWAQLAPEELGAHEVRAALYLKEGRPDDAFDAMREMVRIGAAQGVNGYAEVAEVVSESENQDLGRLLMGRLVAEDPASTDGRYAYALVLLAFGDFAAAEREVEEALRLDPRAELAWLLLNRIRMQQGLEEAGGKALKQGVAANPRSRAVRVAYARWLVEAARYEEAYAQFKQLLKMMPDDSDVLFALGALATDLDRWNEARGFWHRLLAQGERVDEARYFLAQVEESTGNEDKALALYRGVQGGPLRMEAAIRRAEILAQRGAIVDARRVMAEQRVLFPEHAASLYLMEAELVRDYGLPAEVGRIYDTALGVYPDNPDLLYARAMHAASELRLEESERDLRAIIERDPDHADALNALGYTLVEQTDRYQEAFDLISRALKLKPESAAILDSMGWVNYRLGNLDAALDYLKRAAARDGNSEIAAHLGEVLWVIGHREEALRVWGDALGRDPESAYLLETMQRFRTLTP